MPERMAQLLGDPLVHAIDAYFTARRRLITALIHGDEEGAQQANDDSRRALSDWLALLVERLDSRNAAMLVELYKHVEQLLADHARLSLRVANLEGLMGLGASFVPPAPGSPPPDGDDGHAP